MSNDTFVLGVDLGLNGGLSLISQSKRLIACEKMPTIETKVGKKLRNQYDLQAIHDIISGWNMEFKIVRAGMERLRPIPGQSSQTGFSMGQATGIFKTIFTCLEIPFIEMEPREWQKSVFGELGVQYDRDTTKQASIQAAKQLFPYMDFRPTERCKVASDGMTDSANISYYLLKI